MKPRLIVGGLVLLCLLISGFVSPAYGLQITPTDPTPSSSSTYQIQLAASAPTVLRCIRLQFNTEMDGSGSVPPGMNISAASLNSSQTDFVPTPASWVTNNAQGSGVISITNASGEAPNSGNRSLIIDNLVNPSTPNGYWMIINTYSNANCSAGGVDSLVVAFVVSGSSQISVNVIPALTFTVTGRPTACNGQTPTSFSNASNGSQVSLGHINKSSTGGGAQDLSVTTVGPGGFTVSISSPNAPNAMNDGHGHVIADIPGTHAFPGAPPFVGVEGFGYTSNDALTGFGVDQFAKLTQSSDSVLYAAPGTVTKAGCVGFEAAASSSTTPGAYGATVQYTAIPNF